MAWQVEPELSPQIAYILSIFPGYFDQLNVVEQPGRLAKFQPLLIFTNLYWAVTTALFVWRGRTPAVTARGFRLSLISMAASLTLMWAYLRQVAFTTMDCNAMLWLANIALPTFTAAILGRAVRLITLYRMSVARNNKISSRSDAFWVALAKRRWIASESAMSVGVLGVALFFVAVCLIQHRWTPPLAITPYGLCTATTSWRYWPSFGGAALLIAATPVIIALSVRTRDIHGIVPEYAALFVCLMPQLVAFLAVFFSPSYNASFDNFKQFPIYALIWIAGFLAQTITTLWPLAVSFGALRLTPLRAARAFCRKLIRSSRGAGRGRSGGSSSNSNSVVTYTTQGLAKMLSSVEGFAALRAFAVREFTVENMIFLQEYMDLLAEMAQLGLRSFAPSASTQPAQGPAGPRSRSNTLSLMRATLTLRAMASIGGGNGNGGDRETARSHAQSHGQSNVDQAAGSVHMSQYRASIVEHVVALCTETPAAHAADSASAAAAGATTATTTTSALAPGAEPVMRKDSAGSDTAAADLAEGSISMHVAGLPQELLEKMRCMHGKFVQIGSDYELNITAGLRKPLAEMFRDGADSGLITAECFESVAAEVIKMVYLNTFSNYVKQSIAARRASSVMEAGSMRSRNGSPEASPRVNNESKHSTSKISEMSESFETRSPVPQQKRAPLDDRRTLVDFGGLELEAAVPQNEIMK